MSGVVIRPLRFTDRVGEMRAFLEGLGLRARIESEKGGWVDMRAGRGMVALHDAASSSTGGQPGQTRLSFEAEDIGQLKEELEAAGYEDVVIWDEAYGRVLRLPGPGGEQVWVDERSDDLYGYKLNDASPDAGLEVTPLLDSTHELDWRKLLSVFGLTDAVSFGTPQDVVQLEFTRPGEALQLTDPDGQTVVVHG